MAAVRLTGRLGGVVRPPGGRAGRILATSITVDAVGRGLFLAGSVVFFTREVGLSAAEVGAGLAIAGLVGLLAGYPVGLLADRFGARRVLVGLHIYRAFALAAYTLIESFTGFVLVGGLVAVAAGSTVPVLQTLVGDAVGAEQRVTTMGYLRAVQNAGFAVGGLLAAGAIGVDTRTAYVALILVNAASFVVSAFLVRRLPTVGSTRRAGSARALDALRDIPFLIITAGNGILQLHTTLLAVGVPLWILLHTSMPPVVVAAVFVLNTVLAVALQVPVSATATTLPGSGTAFRRAGLSLAVCCVLLVASGYQAGAVAVALLVLAVIALTFGEMLQAAAAWSAGYALAPEQRRASYLSVLGMGSSVQSMAGPVIITAVVGVGTWGLLLLAAGLMAAAEVARGVIRGRGGSL
ncbi:MFS transporter [Actinophytocola sp. NPDC049390]|uniref:MFS transporter n=1 Tax=Actinophytocola sp. NPDC049390 TaxID=3363894 RepID=UPI0037A90654